jgi:hypothetical protein
VVVLDDLVEVLYLHGLSITHPTSFAQSGVWSLESGVWSRRRDQSQGNTRRRTWFSSHMVMKRSKDRPPSTILNFWPVPSASAGASPARPARPTSKLYADGIVAQCCYGIMGEAKRQGGRSRTIACYTAPGCSAPCFVSRFICAPPARLQGPASKASRLFVALAGPWQLAIGLLCIMHILCRVERKLQLNRCQLIFHDATMLMPILVRPTALQ